MVTSIKPGEDVKQEFDELQVERGAVRRAITIREAHWSAFNPTRSDLPTVETEEFLRNQYHEKLESLEEKLRRLLILSTTDELAAERNNWEDRVTEYQTKLARGRGKIAHVKQELTKVKDQIVSLGETTGRATDGSSINRVIVKQEPKIPKFFGDGSQKNPSGFQKTILLSSVNKTPREIIHVSSVDLKVTFHRNAGQS